MSRSWFVWLAAAAFACTTASAQTYPVKPVRLIVPFAPGGGTDLIGRLLALSLGDALGQSVVVDNRGGAGSTLGTELATKAAPDGYTLLLGNISLAFNAELYKKLSYDALRDLSPISLVAVQPNILVVHPALPAKTVAEFARLARSRPGQIAYGSAGVGSGTHLAGELLKMLLKIDLLHVPYKGTGPALTDLVGGQVQMMVSTFASALPHVRTGRMRALGVTTTKRSAAAPDVPTLIEAGVAGFEYSTWYAMFAPAGTPRPIVDQLNKTLQQLIGRDELKQRFDAQGVEAIASTSADLAAYLKSETAKWGKVVKATGARGE